MFPSIASILSTVATMDAGIPSAVWNYSRGANHRRHMTLHVYSRQGVHKSATYLPKGRAYPLRNGKREAARRLRQIQAGKLLPS